jgi:hypothetical protein
VARDPVVKLNIDLARFFCKEKKDFVSVATLTSDKSGEKLPMKEKQWEELSIKISAYSPKLSGELLDKLRKKIQ